ncbi:MAG: winged helix-turn-helix domain-containing protein [Candidatus Eremiobacteraeota bacterium]|nr:winged helix-turn-helix domain-containing protein [Candidatus Eremiobacteraeota bacterium]
MRRRVKDLGFRSFLCVPIPGPEQTIGSLTVAWRDGAPEHLSHCLTLSREAERLGLMLDRLEHESPLALQGLPIAEGLLDVRVLGSFALRRGAVALSLDSFPRRRAITLLKILLTHHGKVVLRDELVELLWDSETPKDGGQLLKIVVHYLRRGLGQAENARGQTAFILTEPHGYLFNPASLHRFDALEFEKHADEGFQNERRGRWREALVELRAAADIYSGDFLGDEPYSDWCVRRRRQLREKLFDVLLTIARLLRSAGDYEAAIPAYRRLLEIDPCLEEVHRDLMEVLHFAGKRTLALRQFEACRTALRDEFDVGPSIETETLYRSILAGSTG